VDLGKEAPMRNRFLVALGLLLAVSTAFAGEIKFGKDFKKALEMSKASGKPIMLDFYTDW
jgi:hypothetical protein